MFNTVNDLGKCRTYRYITCVRVQYKGFFKIAIPVLWSEVPSTFEKLCYIVPSSEKQHFSRKSRYKATIIGTQPNKASYFMDISWLRPILHSFNFNWICRNSFLLHHITQICDFSSKQGALLWIQFQICFPQPFQHTC